MSRRYDEGFEMTDLPDRLGSLWRALRVHPAFQAAVVYAGVGWVMIQAGAIFFPTFGFPSSAVRWLAAVVAVGFFATILLAWRAAAAPEIRGRDLYEEFAGETRPSAGELHARGGGARKRAYGLAAALLIVGSVIWWAGPRVLKGGVAPDAEVIAVLPFTTSGEGSALLGEGMVDLLSANLDGVGGIRTVDPRTVLHRWRARAGGGGMDLEDALAVGRDVDAGSVLLGSAIEAGGAMRLSAQLYTLEGSELARLQVEGPADSVLALVDRLSLQLLRETWRSSRPIPEMRVSAITTESVDAVRAYLKGEQHYRRSQFDSAIAAFRTAVEEDSTFALALFRLSMAYGWSAGSSAPDAQAFSQAAMRHAGRLPARERMLVVAHDLFGKGELAALDTAKAYVAQYPDDAEGWYLLGDIQYHARYLIALEHEELYTPFERAIELDPSLTPALIHIIELGLLRADSAEFHEYLNLLESRAGPEPAEAYRLTGSMIWGDAGAAHDAALTIFRETPTLLNVVGSLTYQSRVSSPEVILPGMAEMSNAFPAGDPRRTGLLMGRIFVWISLGRVEEARPLVDSLWAMSPQMGVVTTLSAVVTGHAERSYGERALEYLKTVAASDPVFAAYWRVADALSRGDAAAARELIRRTRAVGTGVWVGGLETSGLWKAFEGWAELVEGDTASGLRGLRAGLEELGYEPFVFQISARLRFEWALALAAWPPTREEGIRRLRYGFELDPYYLPLTYEALGPALEAAGKPEEAARAYAQFIRLWEKADPHLQPRVEAARRALRRLISERSGDTE